MTKKRIEDYKITKEMSINFFNNLTNIASHEWPRVAYCFILKFLLDSGKVVGHTILLSLVALKLGIDRLPIVLVISGILVMVSTTFFSRLLHRVNKGNLLAIIALSASFLLILSRYILSLEDTMLDSKIGESNITMLTVVFFAIYLVAESVMFIQMEIILALYIESYFTSLESQRTFPIIESAQVFAGIVAGSLIAFSHMDTADYIYLWIVCMLLTIPTIFIKKYLAQKRLIKINIPIKRKIVEKGFFEEMKLNIKILKLYPYLKTLTLIVFLYYAIFKIMEFKYTKAFYQSAGGEDSLTHELGTYILIFSVSALFIQLFLSSRIIKKYGIINSMIVNPIFSLISFFFLMFFNSSIFVIGSKFVYDTTSVIYKNGYLSSYYTISHQGREKIKALIEGWVFSLGMIFGTLITVIAQYFNDSISDFILRVMLVGFSLIMFILLLKQRRNYTNTAVRNLNSLDIYDRYNSIEVLGEQGHINNSVILNQKLINWIDNNKVVREKVKILETFGRLKDESNIPSIIDCFEDSSKDVRMAAVKALANFKSVGSRFFTQTFTRYRIVNSLMDLFQKENSKKMKSFIIKVFANLNQIEVVPFLLKILESSSDDIKVDCIAVIGQFNDPNICYYIKPYLASSNPRIRANAIIALWQFKEMRLDLIFELTMMLDEGQRDKDFLLSGIYAIGQLNAKQEEKKLIELLESDDEEVLYHSAISLFKIGNEISIPYILKFLIEGTKEISHSTMNMISDISNDLTKKLDHMLKHEVSRRIHEILSKYSYNYEMIGHEDIDMLHFLYKLINEEKEIIKLERLLVSKKPS